MSRPGVLQLVRLQLVHQADAAALVPAHVEDDAAALGGDGGQRRVELRPAVAAQRAEDVAGEALGVHADQDVLAVADVAAHERDVLDAVEQAAVADGGELAVLGREHASPPPRSTLLSVRRRYAIRSAIEIIGRPCSSAKPGRPARASSSRRR